MAPIPSPAIPVKLEPEFDNTSREVLKVITLYLEKLDKLSETERMAISESLRFLSNPLWRIEGTKAPIEMEWLRKQKIKGGQP